MTTSVSECLNKGVALLLPSLGERMARACSLLHVKAPSRGQQLNLRLVLQSLNDHAVISDLVVAATSGGGEDGDGGEDVNQGADDDVLRVATEEEKRPFVLIKTLMAFTFRHYVSESIQQSVQPLHRFLSSISFLLD